MKVKTNLQKLIKVKSDVKISKLLIQLLWKKTVSKIGKINIFQTKMIPGEKDQRKYQYWSACKESRVRWPGVSGFAVGLVISVLNLPDGQELFFLWNSNYRRIAINPTNQKGFWG